VSRLSRQCGILNVSQRYRPLRSVASRASFHIIIVCIVRCCPKYGRSEACASSWLMISHSNHRMIAKGCHNCNGLPHSDHIHIPLRYQQNEKSLKGEWNCSFRCFSPGDYTIEYCYVVYVCTSIFGLLIKNLLWINSAVQLQEFSENVHMLREREWRACFYTEKCSPWPDSSSQLYRPTHIV
jgi:hypothetical protein